MNRAKANPRQDITIVVALPIVSRLTAAFFVCCTAALVLLAVVDRVAVLLTSVVVVLVVTLEAIGLPVGTLEPLDNDVLVDEGFDELAEPTAPAALLMRVPPSIPIL